MARRGVYDRVLWHVKYYPHSCAQLRSQRTLAAPRCCALHERPAFVSSDKDSEYNQDVVSKGSKVIARNWMLSSCSPYEGFDQTLKHPTFTVGRTT